MAVSDPLFIAIFFFLFLPGVLLLVAVIAGFLEKREKAKVSRDWFKGEVGGKKEDR